MHISKFNRIVTKLQKNSVDYVVEQENGMNLRGCNGSKSLLSSCVPYLQLHFFSINIYCADFKINTNGCNITSCDKFVKLEKVVQLKKHLSSIPYFTCKQYYHTYN